MLLLTSTSDLITLATSAAETVHVQASWIDYTDAGVRTPGRTNTITTTAAITTIVAAPGSATTQRSVRRISMLCTTGTVDISVRHTDGTTAIMVFKTTLGVREFAIFENDLFRIFDANGVLKVKA